MKKLFLVGMAMLVSGQAQALCIVNLSPDTVVYSRGEPIAQMETFYTGAIKPGVQHCTKITARMNGEYPVSIYTIGKRGKCAIVRGCFYETENEQILFRGGSSSSCPIAFQDNSCS